MSKEHNSDWNRREFVAGALHWLDRLLAWQIEQRPPALLPPAPRASSSSALSIAKCGDDHVSRSAGGSSAEAVARICHASNPVPTV